LSLVDLIPLAATFKLTEEPEDDAIAKSFEKGTNLVRREERSIWRKEQSNRFGEKNILVDLEKESVETAYIKM
jgi:hypothetical protein